MIGFILLILAGFCQGSFGLGYKKYEPFSWSIFWGIYSGLCAITAFAAAVIINGGFGGITDAFALLPVSCGALWGISAVCFSKAVTKIGMSMVYGLSMGISTIIGSFMPMIMNGYTFEGRGMLMTGMVLCVCGIVVITVAGIKRDGGIEKSGLGVLLAILSGLGSGAMNVGFSAAQNFIVDNRSAYAMSAISWLPVLIGGLAICAAWCIGEALIKHEWSTLKMHGAAKRCGKLFGVSIIWYAALFLYGIAYAILSKSIGELSWALFNALALLVSVGWGLKTGEWKNSSKRLLFAGCAVLIAAWIFISF